MACQEHQHRSSEAAHRKDWQSIDARIGVWLFLLLGTVMWLASVESRQPGSNMMRYYVVMGLVVIAAFALYVARHRLSTDAIHALGWAALCVPALALLFH